MEWNAEWNMEWNVKQYSKQSNFDLKRKRTPQILINIHLFVKLRHFRHYYHGALDLFIAELMEKQPKLP